MTATAALWRWCAPCSPSASPSSATLLAPVPAEAVQREVAALDQQRCAHRLAQVSMTASASGRCSATHRPARPCGGWPPSPRAMASSVSPRNSMWSMPTRATRGHAGAARRWSRPAGRPGPPPAPPPPPARGRSARAPPACRARSTSPPSPPPAELGDDADAPSPQRRRRRWATPPTWMRSFTADQVRRGVEPTRCPAARSMDSRKAQVLPLPLVPPTCTGAEAQLGVAQLLERLLHPLQAQHHRGRRPRREGSCEPLLRRPRGVHSAHQAQQRRPASSRGPCGDDGVHHAVLEQELRALEALGQLLADGLLDDPRPGEADQRLRLGEDDVAQPGEATPPRRRWSGAASPRCRAASPRGSGRCAAEVFAICISEKMPSCMRAPAEALRRRSPARDARWRARRRG